MSGQDVKLTLDEETGLYDLTINPETKDYDFVNGFDTAVITRIFTDNRAPASFKQDAKDRRGGIANMLLKRVGDSLGSINWCYDQSKLKQDTLNALKLSTQDSLNSMITNGEVKQVSVEVEQVGSNEIKINIKIIANTGEPYRYSPLWKNTEVR